MRVGNQTAAGNVSDSYQLELLKTDVQLVVRPHFCTAWFKTACAGVEPGIPYPPARVALPRLPVVVRAMAASMVLSTLE